MKHTQTYAEIIKTEQADALAEQREPDYQRLFMLQLQKHQLNSEHWLTLLLHLESLRLVK